MFIVKDGKEKYNYHSKEITLFLEKILDIVIRLKELNN
jgi:hypothetical protein